MNYCAGWMRQQENQQLGIPLEVARGFSPRLRKLCGFGLYRGLIGHIDKCSPADLLDGRPPPGRRRGRRSRRRGRLKGTDRRREIAYIAKR